MRMRRIALLVMAIGCTILFKKDVYASTEFIINPDGSGDFVTIQEGVDAAEDGDTLVIFPGIYREHVEIFQKTVNLVGTDPQKCIIEYDTHAYTEVPLNISAGEVCNLTIYGRMRDFQDYEMGTLMDGFRYTGYAVHIDNDYEYGRELVFRNCILVSDNNLTVGLGCRGDSHITFEDCDLIHTRAYIPFGMHDSQSKDYEGSAKISFVNTTFASSENANFFRIWSVSDGNWTELEFQNIKFAAVKLAEDYFTNGYGWEERSSRISLAPCNLEFWDTIDYNYYEGKVDNEFLNAHCFAIAIKD